MKKLYFFRQIIFLFFFFISSALPQIEEKFNDFESIDGGIENLFNDLYLDSFKQKEELIPVSSSILHSYISLDVENENLIRVLKNISLQSGARMIYDDQLLNIGGINLYAQNSPLYKVLEELLNTYDISYYEYETGKIAFAKRRRIDENTGGIKGIIKDDTGESLIGANIIIKELMIGCASDSKGYYIIKNIKPGEYTLEVSFIGYEKHVQKIKIRAGEIIEINIKVKSTTFQIGGIEVIGTQELLPKDVTTKTVITSGEIEHYQASSLKDVLDLVPGVQKTDNPGLGKTSQVAVRGDEANQLSAFGTLIVVDGTPVSNNANLQFERLSGSKFGGSNMGAGVDLRTIPADNIESIEVITGLPSVRYGDVTAGVINVQTKIGSSPNRLKIKNNPDTREGNLGGGFLIGENGLSYNINLAQSERDIRKTGDEYLRLTGQTVYSSNFFDNQISTNTKFNFQTIYDEEEPKGDQQLIKNYNRGFTLGLSNWGKYRPLDGVSVFDYSAFVTMRRENTMKSKLIQSDLRILPNGDTVSIYFGKVETKGIEWTAGGRLEWNRVFYTGNLIHKFLIGTEPQYNANTGEGVMFDTLFNYYGAESGRRPYSFNDIPGQFLMNLYIEDKMTGNFIFDFNLQVGLRYEMYRPTKFNLSGLWGDGDIVESHQGTFFNPRVNLMIYLSDINQVRISAGTTSKSPSMSVIYPQEDVFVWRNPLDSVNIYYNYNRWVPDLKGYREAQYEVSYDHKFFNLIGTSVSFYYKKRTNETRPQSYPVFFSQTKDNVQYVYYIDSYGLSVNSGWTDSKGIEFSLRTSKIKPLNMEFQIVGAYNYLKSGSGTYTYNNTPDSSIGQYNTYQVPGTDKFLGMIYRAGYTWNDRFQLNYYIKYTCAPLGLWITLRAEQLLYEKNQNLNQTPRDLSMLNETQLTSYLFDRAIKIKPIKWLFNLNISKSLFSGAEVSFYVNNFLDNPATNRYYNSPTTIMESSRNPALSYGIEFSMIIDNLLGMGK